MRLCFDLLLSHFGLSESFHKICMMLVLFLIVIICWIILTPVAGAFFQSLFLCATPCRLTNNPQPPTTATSAIFLAPYWVQTKRPILTCPLTHSTSLSQEDKYIRCINSSMSLQTSVKYFFSYSLMGLKDFQQRVALFTLYSRVGYFHLNECVWLAVGFRYCIFRHTCVNVYVYTLCILYVPACTLYVQI